MSQHNPYQPPQSPDLELEKREHETAAGSSIRVGERRWFTGRRLGLTVFIHAMLATAHLLTVLTVLLPFPGPIFGVLGGVSFLYLLTWYDGRPQVERYFRRQKTLRPNDFVIEFQLIPRLPYSLLEAMDTADDVGVLSVDKDALRYEGDRVTLQLKREDVTNVKKTRWLQYGGFIGCDLELSLAHPLCSRQRLRIGIREGRSTLASLRRGQELSTVIMDWVQSTEGDLEVSST